MDQQPQAVTPAYLDKGLWVAVLTPLALFLNQKFGLKLDPLEIVALVLPVASYIIGHKWKSGTIAAAQVAAQGAAQSPGATLNG